MLNKKDIEFIVKRVYQCFSNVVTGDTEPKSFAGIPLDRRGLLANKKLKLHPKLPGTSSLEYGLHVY